MFNLGGDFASLAMFDDEFQAFHERPRGLTTDLESPCPQFWTVLNCAGFYFLYAGGLTHHAHLQTRLSPVVDLQFSASIDKAYW